MGIEIERKFLVRELSMLAGVSGVRMVQGYLNLDAERTVRVRLAEGEGRAEAWLTIKGKAVGLVRREFEYLIPVDDARAMLAMVEGAVIDKTRYRIQVGRWVWEVDVFHGENEGLVVAEIELEREDEGFERPQWLGSEVSGQARYVNSRLVREPYRSWPLGDS